MILPAATFVLGDTDAEAEEIARRGPPPAGQRRRPRSSSWSSCGTATCPAYDPDGPLPDDRPGPRRAHHRPRPRQRPDVPRPAGHRPRVAGAAPTRTSCRSASSSSSTGTAVLHRLPGHRRRDDQRLRAGGRGRRLHPRPAHHPGRPRRVRRHGRAAAPGARASSAPSTRARPCATTSASARAPTPRPPARAGGVMKFLAITLIVHAPDPVTGVQKSDPRAVPRGRRQRRCWPRSSASTASAWASGTSGRSSPPRRRSCSATSPR